MKRYFITLALLLLLLTLLIPSSLPTATAAPLNDTDKEYHPGINAKQLKVYQKAVKTADCGDLPPMACTPDGPNDPGDQEKLIHDRIIPGGTTVDEVTITNNPPTEHYQYEKCGYPAEQWRETNYDQVDLSLGYPPEYSEQPDTIRGYKQGFKDRITITGLWILPPYHHPDCEKALHGTAIEETNLSGRYTLTDAPDKDGDKIADKYDACEEDPGSAAGDGCPEICEIFTSTGRWGNLTVRNLVEAGIPVPDEAMQFLDRTLRISGFDITGPLAFVQLKGEWCYQNGHVSSIGDTRVQALPTSAGDYLFDISNTYAGIFRQQERVNQTDYLNDQTRTDIILKVPIRVTFLVPGTNVGIEVPAGTEAKIATIILTTRLSGRGGGECTQTGNPLSCTIDTTVIRSQ